MRIGFDGGCLANRRGFGRFARLLLSALAKHRGDHQIIVVIDGPSASSVELPEGVEALVVDIREAPSSAASARGRRRFRDMLAMGRAVARARFDLMYFPATYTFYPVWKAPRLVVTMHDTLPLEHPELVFPTRRGRAAWMLKEKVAARMADRIVTVSETSKRFLMDRFRLADDRLRVVGEAPAKVFRPLADASEADDVLRRYGLSPVAPYLLYVGGLSPHKNLPRLVEGFAGGAPADASLVLVGDLKDVFHTHVPEIRRTVEREGLGDRVVFAGFVPDDDLVYLYSRAQALALPSLLEGFGLPAVEAMACGVPVAASRAGSLPEVVGDAGLLFDPLDVASIAGALGRLFADRRERDRLAALALNRAARFSWDRSARELIACFEELAPPSAPAP